MAAAPDRERVQGRPAVLPAVTPDSRHGLTFGEYEVLAALARSGAPQRLKPTDLVGALLRGTRRLRPR
jgi:hypothetical protein